MGANHPEYLTWWNEDQAPPFLMLYVPFPDEVSAMQVARMLLEKRLCACTNLLRGGTSLFWWQGKIDEQPEVILIVKTAKRLLKSVVKEIHAGHPYTVPAILLLPIWGMPRTYAEWMKEELSQP